MRERHDGFTAAKRQRFFAAVEKSGCIRDGCRAAPVSPTTVTRWRNKAPGFEEEFQRRIALAAGALETLAWERATVGAEEKVIRGGEVVQIKVKPSDALLRLLLQGAAPEKYGRTGGPAQAATAEAKRIRAELRAEIEPELRAEIEAGLEEQAAAARVRILAKVARLRERMLREGYSRGPNGAMVPPGWKLVREAGAAPGGPAAWRDPVLEAWSGAAEGDEGADESGGEAQA